MRSDWNLYKIGELCDTISDTYNRSDDMVILINTSDVLAGKIINHSLVSNKNLKGQFKKTFRKNDILYSEIRPINKRFAFIDFEDTEKYIASTKLMVLRSHKDIILPYFLFSLLQSQDMINKLQHLAETRSGTFPQITFLGELAPIEVKIPDLNTQSKIVSILSAIDEKIELNNAINKNLEQQAFSLFDISFPNVVNGNKTIGDKITPKRGKSLLSKNAIVGDVPVVAGGLAPSTYHNVSNTQAPVVTISASGANAGFINLWNMPVWASDSSFIDNSVTSNVFFWYVMLKKRQKEIFATQTGSAQPHIYPKHIAEMPMTDISEKQIKDYEQQVTSIFELIGANKAENKRLSEIRDTLLPKLMNGEIDISAVKV